jgi:hypothetical protein
MTIYNENNDVVEIIEDCLSVDAEQISSTLYGVLKHSIKLIKSQEEYIKDLETKIVQILNYIFINFFLLFITDN